jgi:hypothetical protein
MAHNTNYRTRIIGSSYTVWTANSKPIIWCVDIDHESPRTVADPVPIQPLNYIRPAEIIVPRAISYGKITMNVIETYGNKPWDYLNGFFPDKSYNSTSEDNQTFSDLADVLNYMQDQLTNSDASSLIELYRIIRTPGSSTSVKTAGSANPWYVTKFEGVRITDIRENEKANTNAMQNNLQIECMYTRKVDTYFDPTGDNFNVGGAGFTGIPTGAISDGGGGYFGD